MARRFSGVVDDIGRRMAAKLEDARNNNTGSRIRTRSGNTHRSLSKIEQLIVNSFIYKLWEASKMDFDRKTHM